MHVIKRVLRGTSFVATLGLDKTQALHFEVAEGGKLDEPTPMDPEVMREMINLAAHFREPGPWEMAVLVADEVRKALDGMVGGHDG